MSPLPSEAEKWSGPAMGVAVGAAGAGAAVGVVAFPAARMVFLVGLVVVAVLLLGYVYLTKWLAARKAEGADAEIAQGFGRAPSKVTDPQQLANLARLSKQFKEGVEKFKAHGLKLSDMPWYLIIGEPASGKSEAIRQCGLTFPDGLNQRQQGTGGTVNMNWWFTEEGVILDTAGRFVTQADSTNEWQQFLELIKRARKDYPINGMLLVVPVSKVSPEGKLTGLLVDTEEEVRRKAEKVASFVENVRRTLGVRFPVYVLVTKCDQIPGFRETFADLRDERDREERSPQHQMLGWSNPGELDTPFDPGQVEEYLGGVKEQLLKRRNALLADPPAPAVEDLSAGRIDQVDALYQFPDAMGALAPKLRTYLQTIFTKSKFNQNPLFLRGIYFTSALEEGRELDEKLATVLGKTLDEMRQDGMGYRQERAVFLRDVFKQKVLQEWGLVTTAPDTRKLQRGRKLALLGTGFAAIVILGGLVGWAKLRLVGAVEGQRVVWDEVARDMGEKNWRVVNLDQEDGSKGLTYAIAGEKNDRKFLDKGVELDGTPGEFFARRQGDAARPIRVPFPLSMFGADLTGMREDATRAMFDRYVLKPVVEVARLRVRNGRDEVDVVGGPGGEGLVELVKLEKVMAGGGLKAEGDRPKLDTLMKVVLTGDEYASVKGMKVMGADGKEEGELDALNGEFAALYPVNGKEWGNVKDVVGADVRAVVEGLRQLTDARRDAADGKGAEFVPVGKAAKDLTEWNKVEGQLVDEGKQLGDLSVGDYTERRNDLGAKVGGLRTLKDQIKKDLDELRKKAEWKDSLAQFFVSRRAGVKSATLGTYAEVLAAAGDEPALNEVKEAVKTAKGEMEAPSFDDVAKKKEAEYAAVDGLLEKVEGGYVYEVQLGCYEKVNGVMKEMTVVEVPADKWGGAAEMLGKGFGDVDGARAEVEKRGKEAPKKLAETVGGCLAWMDMAALPGARYVGVAGLLSSRAVGEGRVRELLRGFSPEYRVPVVLQKEKPTAEDVDAQKELAQYSPKALDSLSRGIGAAEECLKGKVVDRKALAQRVESWKKEVEGAKGRFAKFWTVDVMYNVAPGLEGWGDLRGRFAATSSTVVGPLLRQLLKAQAEAVGGGGVAGLDNALIVMNDQDSGRRVDEVFRYWKGLLEGTASGARGAVLAMTPEEVLGRCFELKEVPCWKVLELKAVGMMAGPASEEDVRKFDAYANEFPLSASAGGNGLTSDRLKEARQVLQGILKCGPGNAAGGTIAEGAVVKDGQIDEVLEKLRGAGVEDKGLRQKLGILNYFAGGAKCRVTMLKQEDQKALCEKANKSPLEALGGGVGVDLNGRGSVSVEGTADVALGEIEVPKEGVDLRVTGDVAKAVGLGERWGWVRLVLSNEAKVKDTSTDAVRLVPVRFTSGQGDRWLWLQLELVGGAGKLPN